jgi:oligoribonuclease
MTITMDGPSLLTPSAKDALEGASRCLCTLISQFKTDKGDIMTDTEIAKDYLLWVDVETTGLDLEEDSLLEIELRLTDMHGETIDSFYTCIQPRDGIRFDRTALRMHAVNNLLSDACDADYDQYQAIEALRDWMGDDVRPRDPETWYLAGSSVHFDLAWLKRNGVDLDRYSQVHHRRLDLSSIRILLDSIDPQYMTDITDGIPRTDHRTGSCLDRDIATYQSIRAWLNDTTDTTLSQPEETATK